MTARPGVTERVDGPVHLRYGDYFDAVHRFLARDDFRMLNEALEQRLMKRVDADRLHRVKIFLVKHGEFYHPARIELQLDGQRLNFVLNVAVSEIGRGCLANEFRCLTRLGRHPASAHIPRVYGQGEVASPAGPNLLMWLGEWFEEFHEFHWAGSDAGGKPMLGIWDPCTGKRYLDDHQTGLVFSQAAAILTDFFNLTTFEQIHSWHHAAGDFVLRQQHDRIDVRLVTVRNYTGMLAAEPQKSAPELTLQAMLLFLIRLSLRMRLDRLDGVGDLVWADEAVVRHTVAGFRSALVKKWRPSPLPETPIKCFDVYMARCSEADLRDIVKAVIAAYPTHHPEKRLLIQKAQAHAAVLYRTLSDSLGDAG